MTELTSLPEETITAAITSMNGEHQDSLLAYARVLAGAGWAEQATLTGLDSTGFDLLIAGAGGRQETQRITFDQPITDAGQLRMAFVQLADRADLPDGIHREAAARVETAKATRYLKAMCNHFDRKVNAGYSGNTGRVQFPFGSCSFVAEDDALLINVTADSQTRFARVKAVIADHLIRFAAGEDLQVDWVEVDARQVAR